METGQTLIDKASAVCGGLRRLAAEIDENPGFLSLVRNGKKPLPPTMAARIALVARQDARRAVLEAVVSQEKDRKKQIALANALGVEVPPEPQVSNGLTVQLA